MMHLKKVTSYFCSPHFYRFIHKPLVYRAQISKPGIREKASNEDTDTEFLRNLTLKVPFEGLLKRTSKLYYIQLEDDQ